MFDNTYYLIPKFDSRASFYNKAIVEIRKDGTKVLYSYMTEVAEKSPSGELKVRKFWDSSATTLRHVKEFLKQEGLGNIQLTNKNIKELVTVCNY